MCDQDVPIDYDPTTGRELHKTQWLRVSASKYREYYGVIAWVFNPWTGQPRDLRDVGSDVEGKLIEVPKRCVRRHQIK